MKARLLALVLLLSACGVKDQLPPTPLSREKFTEVLAASLLVEARVSHEMIVDKRMDSPIQRYYDEMFRQQGVSQADFKSTYDIYAEHPEFLRAAYEDVLVKLQERRDTPKAH